MALNPEAIVEGLQGILGAEHVLTDPELLVTTSFGHLMPASMPSSRSVSATATPATSDS